MQSHHPKHRRHRHHLPAWLETFSSITLHGAGCFVSKAMARICISAKSIFSPVVEKMLMVAGASPALVPSLLIHGDQFRVVRCLAFGLPVPHSPRSGQFCVLLCNSVTVPVSPTLRFAARSPSSTDTGFLELLGCLTSAYNSQSL